MEQKKLIPVFVDIDGVVNSTRSVFVKIGPDEESNAVKNLEALCGHLDMYVLYALKTVDIVCVALINRLFEEIEKSGCEPIFVLSSTHRKYLIDGIYGSKDHLNRLREYMKAMGFKVPQKFDVTEVLHEPRGNEVSQWMNTNGFDDISDKYVIIDDSRDFAAYQPLVRVDASIGFSFENFAEASKYLGLRVSNILI